MRKLALTAAQQGIWLGQQLQSDSPMYLAAEYLDIAEGLDVARFRSAWQQTLAQSAALRVCFDEQDNQPYQFVADAADALPVIDLRQENDVEQVAQEWMAQDLQTPIDLRHQPPFRSALLRLSDERYWWYLCIHHIASDGYSFGLLTQHVVNAYQQSSPVYSKPSVKQTFGDYRELINLDEHYQQSKYRDLDKAFWVEHLGQSDFNYQPSMAPGSDYADQIADRAIRFSKTLPSSWLEQVQSYLTKLVSSDRISGPAPSWGDVALASVAALYYHKRGVLDIRLGVPVMGRMGSAAVRIPGMVMNICPLLLSLQHEPLFADLVAQASLNMRQSRPHQRYRYEQLRRDLGLVGGEQRLFGPVVNVMPFDRHLRLAEQPVTVHNLSAGPVEDISFAFVQLPQGQVRLDIDANPNNYSLEDLERLASDWQVIVEQAVRDIHYQVPIGMDEMSWADGGELDKKSATVWHQFNEQVSLRPDALALVDGEQQLDYGSLQAKVGTLAHYLSQQGVGPNRIVAIALPRCSDAIISMLATWQCGAAFVCLDPSGPASRNQQIMIDARPVVVIDPSFITRYQASASTHSDAPENGAKCNTALAYLIYTSGSTGKPKGVMVSQQALGEFVQGAVQSYGWRADDRVLQFAPYHFDACIEEIFVTLAVGATLVLRDDQMLESMASFQATCRAWQISVLDLPTAFWHEWVYACCHQGWQIPKDIRCVIIGGEAVQAERVKDWELLLARSPAAQNIALINTYGPSEAAVVATCQRHQFGALDLGRPLPGRQALIVDEHDRWLAKGQSGELVLAGGGIGLGYWQQPDTTERAFGTLERYLDLPWAEGLPCYRTGDRVRMRDDGKLVYLGRIDDQIKISGQRIDPLEVEQAIMQMEGVEQAAVVVRHSKGHSQFLAAFLVGQASDPVALRQRLSQQLPAAMVPSCLQFIDKLPKSASGKVDRKQLKNWPIATIEENDVAVLSAQQRLIAEVWQEILGVGNIQAQDDFFALGGQSLQTIQVANRLSAKLGCEVPVATLFRYPTLEGLALALGLPSGSNNERENSGDNRGELTQPPHFEQDAKQLAQIALGEHIPASERQPSARILTGATGFVGIWLLKSLLEQTSETVICLIRAQTEQQARIKLHDAARKQQLQLPHSERIRIVLADLTQPNLGLSEANYQMLIRQSIEIYHNAAQTSVMRDYVSLRETNVLSTLTLLQIAAKAGCPLHFVSTIAVAPPANEAAALGESAVDAHTGLIDGYQQSKWVAETLVNCAREQGVATRIYRLGRVVGALGGAAYVNPTDLVWTILAAAMRLRTLPTLTFSEPWTPVDSVASTLTKMALADKGPFVANLIPSQWVSMTQIMDWLQQDIGELAMVSMAEWCQRLANSANPEDQTLYYFFEQRKDGVAEMAPIERGLSARAMDALAIHWPQISQAQFRDYLAYALEHRLISLAEPEGVELEASHDC